MKPAGETSLGVERVVERRLGKSGMVMACQMRYEKHMIALCLWRQGTRAVVTGGLRELTGQRDHLKNAQW